MKKDSLGQDLTQAVNNAESWMRQSEQQLLVAESIAQHMKLSEPTEVGNLLRVGYLKTTALLLALSIENSLKAVKASRGEFLVNKGTVTRASRGGGTSGHSLDQLANEVGLVPSELQQALLLKLTEIGIWAGKYHVPLHNVSFENANASNPRSLTVPHDMDIARTIVLWSATATGVRLVSPNPSSRRTAAPPLN